MWQFACVRVCVWERVREWEFKRRCKANKLPYHLFSLNFIDTEWTTTLCKCKAVIIKTGRPSWQRGETCQQNEQRGDSAYRFTYSHRGHIQQNPRQQHASFLHYCQHADLWTCRTSLLWVYSESQSSLSIKTCRKIPWPQWVLILTLWDVATAWKKYLPHKNMGEIQQKNHNLKWLWCQRIFEQVTKISCIPSPLSQPSPVKLLNISICCTGPQHVNAMKVMNSHSEGLWASLTVQTSDGAATCSLHMSQGFCSDSSK